MKRNQLFLLIIFILLMVPLASAGWVTNVDFPYLHYVDTENLTELQATVTSQPVYSGEVDVTKDDNLLYDLKLVEEDTIDTGLNENEGIHLNWEKKSLTYNCLVITVNKSIGLLSGAGKLILLESNTNANHFQNQELWKLETKTQKITQPTRTCNWIDMGQYDNGSVHINYACTDDSYTKTQSYVEETPLPFTESVVGQNIREDTFDVDGNSKYKYCFNTPVEYGHEGFGSKGTLYFELDGKMYVDKQHSSWWNQTFQFRRYINISNQLSSTILAKYWTVEASGWNTTDTVNYNRTNFNNFEAVCENSTVSAIVGNRTDLLSNGNGSKLYPDSSGWFTTNTTILFRLPQNISATSSNSTMCAVYYGLIDYNSTSYNMSQIALMYDDFNRADQIGSMGNGWITDAGAQITSNEFSCNVNNCNGKRALDIGNISDGDSYMLLTTFKWGGTAGGGITECFTDSSGAVSSACMPASPAIGTRFGSSPESTAYLVIDEAGTTIKLGGHAWPNGVNFAEETIAFDDVNRGDYVTQINSTQFLYNTTNLTNTASGNKWGVHIQGNRAADKATYMMIRRWQSVAPTVTVLAEQTNVTAPILNNVYLNTTNPNNYTNGSLILKVDVSNPYTANYTIWFRNDNYTQHMKSLENLTTIPSNDTEKRDNWTVMVHVCDATNDCTSNLTGNVTIVNSPPDVPTQNAPNNMQIIYSNTVLLNCTSTDQDTGDTVYEVFYADTSNPPTTLVQNSTNTAYNLTVAAATQYFWYCRAHDNESRSSNTSVRQVDGNTAPSITGLNVNTTYTANYTNATVNASFTTSDVNVDPLSIQIDWYLNNVRNMTFANQTNISAGNTTKGDNFTAIISVRDGFLRTNRTSTVIIRNAPPDWNSMNITSDANQNYSNANWTVAAAFTDIDNDSIIYREYQWQNNSLIYNTLANQTIANANQTYHLDVWQVAARASDGTNLSTWTNTTFIVRNFLPNITSRDPANNISLYHIQYPLNCSRPVDNIDGDTINVEIWDGNRSTGNWAMQQNSSTLTNLTYTWTANYTIEYACRSNDAINVSSFLTPNVSIEFNNSLVYGNLSTFVGTIASGVNTTYRLNLSWNGIAIRNLIGNFTIDNNRTTLSAEENVSGVNTTSFLNSYVLPINSSPYNVSFYWNVSLELWNGSIINPVEQFSDTQHVESISVYTAGCNGTSNATQWAILNVTFGDEVNESNYNESLDGVLTFYAIGTDRSNNFTTTVGTINVNQTFICVKPNNQTNAYGLYGLLRYSRAASDPREYYLVNLSVNSNTQNLRLYSLDISLANGITFLVEDDLEQPLKSRYIYVDRFDVNNNTFRTIAMGKTDEFGKDYIFLRKFDALYRFRLQEDTRNIFLSEIQKIKTDTLTFTITPGTAFDQLIATEKVSYNLSFDNSTGLVRLTFLHTDPEVTQSCLTINQYSLQNSSSQFFRQCSTASSGTIQANLSTNGTFYASYTVLTSGITKQITAMQIFRTFNDWQVTLGRNGLWLAVIWVGTITFAGIYSPAASIILLLVGVIGAALIGILNVTLISVFGLAAMGGYLISKLKR